MIGSKKRIFFLELVQQIINTLCLCLVRLSKSVISLNFILLQILGCFQNSTVITFWNTVSFIFIFLISCFLKNVNIRGCNKGLLTFNQIFCSVFN